MNTSQMYVTFIFLSNSTIIFAYNINGTRDKIAVKA